MRIKTVDSRIAGLSYAEFEKEFGFKPKNKNEQTLFALKGRRPDPRILAAVVRFEAARKAKKGE